MGCSLTTKNHSAILWKDAQIFNGGPIDIELHAATGEILVEYRSDNTSTSNSNSVRPGRDAKPVDPLKDPECKEKEHHQSGPGESIGPSLIVRKL